MRLFLQEIVTTLYYMAGKEEVLESLCFILCWFILIVAGISQAIDGAAHDHLFRIPIIGVEVERTISLGALGIGIGLCWQVGRWGRRVIRRFIYTYQKK